MKIINWFYRLIFKLLNRSCKNCIHSTFEIGKPASYLCRKDDK